MFFKQETNQPNKKYCPTYIISYELSPREEIILEHSLKGKSECVPTTPKIFQSTGIPFLVIWVKGRNNNRAEADGKSWGSCPCCTYSDTQCINYPFQVQMFSRLLSSSQHVPSLDTSQKSIVFWVLQGQLAFWSHCQRPWVALQIFAGNHIGCHLVLDQELDI